MKPEIIIMLTHHDVTVKDAGEIFEQCKDLPVKFWGFKNVGLPKDEMKKVAGAMKAAGKTTFLEVVTYDEASCLDGAQTAIDCGFDYLMGTVYYDSVAKLLKENGMAYLPFVGKVSGSPSILEGTNEEIIQNAKDLMAKGIKGFDILAYRHVVDGEKLAREFCAAIDAEICIRIHGSLLLHLLDQARKGSAGYASPLQVPPLARLHRHSLLPYRCVLLAVQRSDRRYSVLHRSCILRDRNALLCSRLQEEERYLPG